MKKAMLNIQNEIDRLNLKAHILIQIHDELLIEVEKSEIIQVESIVKKKMEDVVKLKVSLPVKSFIGKSWGSLIPFQQFIYKCK
jgi:DNA polymerase-1